MDIFMILALIGGLIMFLYGMDLMGDGLKKLAGGKLESILAKLTSNRIKGFLLGFGVTAVIQSSSATTVMLVGFVNSGIMKLGQTIGVILGANVGTTVTSWILSTAEIGKSGSSIMQFFKPESFTPLLALLGYLMIATAKNDRRKNAGTILVGFAILMFGMEAMGDSVSDLKDNPAFTNLLTMFGNNPIMGIIVGTLFTAIIQSSSASVGVLQALALTCAIPYSTAIPLVLGMNIGTTITPIISSVSGNTESKRVAFSCLYIKMIGVAVVAGVFYAINAIVGLDFVSQRASAFNIAVVHTLFNILSTVILLPFCQLFEKLAVATIKGKKDEEMDAFSVLDDRFLNMPSFAVEKSKELVCEMANISNESFKIATKLLGEYDDDTFNLVKKLEGKVDKYEDKISTYLVKIAEKQIGSKESRVVTELLHCIGDIERISDHALNIAEVAQEIHEKKIDFSEKAKADIRIITAAVSEVLDMAIVSMANDDLNLAKCVEPLEQVIDRLKRKIKNGHIDRLRQGDCTMELGFILSDLLTNYERIADHCSNIAVCFIEMSHDSFETHEYLNNLKSGEETEFKEMYQQYKSKYYME